VDWLSFLLGFLAFPLVVLPLLWRFGRGFSFIPKRVTPVTVSSVLDLQPFIKTAMAHPRGTLFVRTVSGSSPDFVDTPLLDAHAAVRS
jgi:hypothetical protein